MADSRVLVITGMHRSGTSLVTSLLQQAGVRIGRELLAPNAGNPRGYFEDREIFDFHEQLLYRTGTDVMVREATTVGRPDDAAADSARRLIAARRQQPLWGFKDPRTALFLDFWDIHLDDARYVFVFRHPIDVLLSLLRRGVDFDVLADPVVGLEAWTVYNRRLLDFYRRNRGRCLLADLYGVTANIDAFGGRVVEKLGLDLATVDLEQLYASGELHRASGSRQGDAILARVAPRAWALYEQLAAEADIAGEVGAAVEPIAPSGVERLAALTEQLVRNESTGAAVATPVFALLLALLDPQLAAPELRRQPLVRYLSDQKRRLSELQAEFDDRTEWMLGLEQRLLALQEEYNERTLWALRLVNQVDKGAADRCELQGELAAGRRLQQGLEERLANREEQLVELEVLNASRSERIKDLEARLSERDKLLAELENRLAALAVA